MISKEEAHDLILELFEEEALVIGGLVAVHEVDNDLVWRLMKNLDVLMEKSLTRLKNRSDPVRSENKTDIKPHPAIEEFLEKLRKA